MNSKKHVVPLDSESRPPIRTENFQPPIMRVRCQKIWSNIIGSLWIALHTGQHCSKLYEQSTYFTFVSSSTSWLSLALVALYAFLNFLLNFWYLFWTFSFTAADSASYFSAVISWRTHNLEPGEVIPTFAITSLADSLIWSVWYNCKYTSSFFSAHGAFVLAPPLSVSPMLSTPLEPPTHVRQVKFVY